MTGARDPRHRDPRHDGQQGRIGPSGLPFPGEHEWLDLPAPAELRIRPDFVDRTLRALRCDEVVFEIDGADEALMSSVLAAHTPPPPAADFVERTLELVHRDRRDRWHEMLARYVAPEPSPEFVARTLAALAADLPAPRRRVWGWPLLALAAAAIVWFALQDPVRPPLESRLAGAGSPAFAHTHAATPLPAVLTAVHRVADPHALPDGGPDGAWLLLGRDR